jgi:hypothetical protein
VTLKGGKKNPFQGRVTKIMTGANCMCYSNLNSNGYENKVKRHLEQVGMDPESFQVGPRAWGTRVTGLPLVEHTKDGEKKNYLEVIFLKAGEVQYLLDGRPVDPKILEGLPEDGPAQAGLPQEKKVHIRTFDLSNITALRLDGKELTT